MISTRKPAPCHLLDTDYMVCIHACTYTCARVYVYEGYMGSLLVCRQRDETFRCLRVNEHLKPRARDDVFELMT